jgi:GntR family transcriptional repressor for pyruvate dehydrogenase complex
MDAASRTHNSFRPLDQKRAFEQIIVQISEAIMDGRLGPGDRLPAERELAETFDVSRASVREALRALEVVGVLQARRGTGPDAGSTLAAGAESGVASALRLHAGLLRIEPRDIIDVRVVLEAHAARRAAATGVVQPELREILATMREASTLDAYHELDTDFHVSIARVSGNALLPVLMESIRSAVRREMLEALSGLEDWRVERDRLCLDHERIIQAIETGDPEAASALVTDHILGFYRGVMQDIPTADD